MHIGRLNSKIKQNVLAKEDLGWTFLELRGKNVDSNTYFSPEKEHSLTRTYLILLYLYDTCTSPWKRSVGETTHHRKWSSVCFSSFSALSLLPAKAPLLFMNRKCSRRTSICCVRIIIILVQKYKPTGWTFIYWEFQSSFILIYKIKF